MNLKHILPKEFRVYLRTSWTRIAIAYYLKRCGYSLKPIRNWAGEKGDNENLSLEIAYECARLEHQPYFKKGLLSYLWPGLNAEGTLTAAADNCLYGIRLEKELLTDWQTTGCDDRKAEKNMIRILNESIIHAVRFCGGWKSAYAGRGFPGNRVMGLFGRLIGECPGRILDIGAGGIPFYRLMNEREDWVASDLNLQALRVMRYALTIDPRHLVCHDAQNIPFPHDSFHVIVSRYVIENILRPHDMIREAARALCPGGSLLLLVPKPMFEEKSYRYFTNRANFPPREEFERICHAAGLQCVHYYEEESVYHFSKAGTLNPNEWTKGYKSPDSENVNYRVSDEGVRFENEVLYPCVDGIPVLIRQGLLYPNFGKLV